VTKVIERNDVLEMHVNYQELSDLYIKFPEHLATTKYMKNSMLCAQCCHDPLAYLNFLIVALFEGN
jgi:hypothetical protein